MIPWTTLVYRHYPDAASMDGLTVTVNRDRSVRVWETRNDRELVANTTAQEDVVAQLTELVSQCPALEENDGPSLEVQADGTLQRLAVSPLLRALFESLATAR